MHIFQLARIGQLHTYVVRKAFAISTKILDKATARFRDSSQLKEFGLEKDAALSLSVLLANKIML